MKLTKNDAQEVKHKLCVLADTPDLQEDYHLTQGQADELAKSVPHNGGEWTWPTWADEAVKGEMDDHCTILRHIASDARKGGEMGQSLSISKQAKRLENLFQTNLC